MTPTDLAAKQRLTQNATPESLRRNHITARHAPTFFSLARQHGMPIARTWLLGALVLDDSNANTHASGATLELQQSLDHALTDPHSSNPHLRRLQQHIETSAAHVIDTPNTPL